MSFGQPPGGGPGYPGSNPGYGSAPGGSNPGGFGQPPGGGYGPPPGGGYGPPGGAAGPKTDPLAYVSIGLGGANLVTCFCCGIGGMIIPLGWMLGAGVAGVLGLVAAVLGFVSVARVNREPETYKGKELALAGGIIGVVCVIISIIMAILIVVLGAAYFAAVTNGGGAYQY